MHSNRQFKSISSTKQSETVDSSAIQSMFELDFHYQLFISRCQDTGEKPDGEKAKMFKEGFNKINSKKFPQILNLHSMRLGVNTIMKLSSILATQKFRSINLADNSISEYGMHAIKNLLGSCSIQSLNIASNMISEVGLSLVLDELIRNNSLKTLDLGILEGSIRKNSIGIDGARCLAAVLLQNRTLECLKLEDNDIGINGAEIISIPLKKNKNLKQLKISENMIKTQGAEYIFQNAINLEVLDLGKNFIKSSIGPALEKYFLTNKNLKKISLELNELLGEGAKVLFEGILISNVTHVNVRGNGIGDRGIGIIANVFIEGGRIHENLKMLDLSHNEITENGVGGLIAMLDHLELQELNLSKNQFSDAGIMELINKLKDTSSAFTLEKIDLSACKMSDKSFLLFLEMVSNLPELRYIRCTDNYISERYEKMFVDLLSQNKTIISLNLQGNRISLSGMKSIKKIIDRNLKEFEEREPKRMKSEIYNMKEKQKKIKQAQEKLDKQKNQIQRLEEVKSRLSDNLNKMEREEKEKRNEFEDSIKKKMEEIDHLAQTNNEKIEDLELLKKSKEENLDHLNDSLDKLKERRKQLEYQLAIIRNEGELIEEEFQRKARMID